MERETGKKKDIPQVNIIVAHNQNAKSHMEGDQKRDLRFDLYKKEITFFFFFN